MPRYLGPTGLSALHNPPVISGHPDGVELSKLLHGLETPGEERSGAQGRQVLQRDALAPASSQHQPGDMGAAALSHPVNTFSVKLSLLYSTEAPEPFRSINIQTGKYRDPAAVRKTDILVFIKCLD